MTISFEGKTALVTGGASGIGKAIVLQLLESGATVIAVDKNEAKPTELSYQKAGKLSTLHCELSDPTSIARLFGKVREVHGKLDILVNNAGVQTYGDVVSTGEDLWDFTMEVNLKSVYLCSKHAIPLMAASTRPVIINVGSVQGFVSQRNVAAYATSKEALHGLTRSIAIDFAPKIRCVAVCPGAVWTPMLQKDIEASENRETALEETRNIHLLKRIGTPEEVANFVTFLASDLAGFATGHAYRVDGGIGLKIEGT